MDDSVVILKGRWCFAETRHSKTCSRNVINFASSYFNQIEALKKLWHPHHGKFNKQGEHPLRCNDGEHGLIEKSEKNCIITRDTRLMNGSFVCMCLLFTSAHILN